MFQVVTKVVGENMKRSCAIGWDLRNSLISFLFMP